MGKKQLTTEEWVGQARKTHGQLYDYSKVRYTKYGCKVVIGCPEHGYFEQTEYNHRNGSGCPKCGVDARAKKRAHDFGSFLAKAREVHGATYEYPEQAVTNNRDTVTVVCQVHGPFQQKVAVHLNGQGCRKCGYARNGKSSQIGISEFMRRAREVHGDTYEYLSGLAGMHRDIKIKCPIHGVFKQTPHNHLKGAKCPHCGNRVSKGELEVAEFIKQLGVKVKTAYRRLIPPLEVDIYCPDHQLAVEYNGLWFHREELVGDKHREKWERCAAVGVKLIQIFEDEWLTQQDKVKARLSAILGKAPVVYARRCRVGRPTKSEARAFLEQTHMQGAGNVLGTAFGLYHGGQLVAVATFGASRFTSHTWELLRYASIGRVVGGVSKVLKAFRRVHPTGTVVSYADLRWGDGETYGKVGFVLDGITAPDYWWADCVNTVRIPRYKVQPKRTGMPEREYAERHGLKRILGVGHKRWVLEEAAV